MQNRWKLIVCIIDEDEITLRAIKKDLEHEFRRFYLEVLTYTSAEAFERAAVQPHIAIVDYYLNYRRPEAMTGTEIIKKIKSSAWPVDVIMFADEDRAGIAELAVSTGLHDYIVKNTGMMHRLRMSVLQCIGIWALRKDMVKQKNMKRFTAIGLAACLVFAACFYFFSKSFF